MFYAENKLHWELSDGVGEVQINVRTEYVEPNQVCHRLGGAGYLLFSMLAC